MRIAEDGVSEILTPGERITELEAEVETLQKQVGTMKRLLKEAMVVHYGRTEKWSVAARKASDEPGDK